MKKKKETNKKTKYHDITNSSNAETSQITSIAAYMEFNE